MDLMEPITDLSLLLQNMLFVEVEIEVCESCHIYRTLIQKFVQTGWQTLTNLRRHRLQALHVLLHVDSDFCHFPVSFGCSLL